MARQVTAQIKLQVPGGTATPAPPVGPALGQHGVNIGQFVSQFNDRSKDMRGITLPVVITVFADKSFTFEVKTPPAAVLLMKAAGLPKGSGRPNTEKVGNVTEAQVTEIAKTKLPDLNTQDIESAKRSVRGTARSMGLTVEG